jgi:hypothetical protein
MEATSAIVDRRWTWQWGFIIGEYNQEDEEGVPVQEVSLYDLIKLCFAALDEYDYSLIDIPRAWPPVSWEYENPGKALIDLCEKYALNIGYDYDNFIVIAPCTYERAIDRIEISDEDSGIGGDILPSRAIVVGGRCIDQVTFYDLVPVGEDTDGTIKRIEDLSYKPDGIDWGDEIKYGFSNIPDYNNKKRADKCIFKW